MSVHRTKKLVVRSTSEGSDIAKRVDMDKAALILDMPDMGLLCLQISIS